MSEVYIGINMLVMLSTGFLAGFSLAMLGVIIGFKRAKKKELTE